MTFTIDTSPIYRFRELVITDFENPECIARSGLMDSREAERLAQTLHEIADQLVGKRPCRTVQYLRDDELAAASRPEFPRAA